MPRQLDAGGARSAGVHHERSTAIVGVQPRAGQGHGDLLTTGVGVVERHLDLVLGQDQAGQPMGGATHAPDRRPQLVVLAGCAG